MVSLDRFVARVARRAERPARDADIDVRDCKLTRTRARNGIEVRRAVLTARLVRAMDEPVPAQRKVALPVTVVERADRTLVVSPSAIRPSSGSTATRRSCTCS